MAVVTTVKSYINNMDEFLHVLCDPCRFSGRTTLAMKYCKDCHGHLCTNCTNNHMKATNTKSHHVTYVTPRQNGDGINHSQSGYQYHHGVTKVVDTKCLEHGKVVVSYCVSHEALCCRVCIGTGHRECRLQVLSEAAAEARGDGRRMQNISMTIKRLKGKFEDMAREKQSNLNNLNMQNDTFTNAVKSYRRTLNNLLDKLEHALLKRKDRHFDTKMEEIRECIKTCQNAAGVLNGSLNKLDLAYRTSDDQQIFLSTKKAQAVTKRFENTYMELEKQPRHYGFHFQAELALEKYLKGIIEFGKIKEDYVSVSVSQNVTTTASHTSWKVKDRSPERRISGENEDYSTDKSADSRTRQASPRKVFKSVSPPQSGDEFYVAKSADTRGRQISPRKVFQSVSPLPSCDEFNIRILSDRKACSITGSDFLPDDKFVVADSTNKKIKIFTTDLKRYAYFETSSAPRDVTVISNAEIACTIPNDKTVQILSVAKEMVIKSTLKLDIECYGIHCHANELYVTSGWSVEKEIHIVDFSGILKKKIQLKDGVLKSPLYVTVNQKTRQIYVSDYEQGVISLDRDGNIIFRCNESATKGYMGLCSSSSGDVFVSTLQPNGISKVTNELRHMGSLPALTTTEMELLIALPNRGGQRPRSIAISKKSNKMLISFVGQSVDVVTFYAL